MNGRDEILARVRAALADVPADDQVEVPRGYLRVEPGDPVELFAERIAEYRTTVVRVEPDGVSAAVSACCSRRGVRRLAAPDELPGEWSPAGVELVPETTLDLAGLAAVDGAISGCALAIAATGTIILDGGPRQGTRRLTLVPDYHLCVIEDAQVVGGVPEATAVVAAAIREARRPITLVSGPSATSDIELSRVEGVHGPRTLDVVLVERPG